MFSKLDSFGFTLTSASGEFSTTFFNAASFCAIGVTSTGFSLKRSPTDFARINLLVSGSLFLIASLF